MIGGTIANLYSTTPTGAPEPRITDNVGCIVEVAPRTAFYQLEEQLRTLGFVNDMTSGVICRWNYQGLTGDVLVRDYVQQLQELLAHPAFAEALSRTLP